MRDRLINRSFQKQRVTEIVVRSRGIWILRQDVAKTGFVVSIIAAVGPGRTSQKSKQRKAANGKKNSRSRRGTTPQPRCSGANRSDGRDVGQVLKMIGPKDCRAF